MYESTNHCYQKCGLYHWVTWLHSRNEHNAVNQLYFSKKKKGRKKSAVSKMKFQYHPTCVTNVEPQAQPQT